MNAEEYKQFLKDNYGHLSREDIEAKIKSKFALVVKNDNGGKQNAKNETIRRRKH